MGTPTSLEASSVTVSIVSSVQALILKYTSMKRNGLNIFWVKPPRKDFLGCKVEKMKRNQIKGLVHKTLQSGFHLGQLLAESILSRQVEDDRACIQLLLDVLTCSLFA